MRIIVIGGSGFIGTYVVAQLVEAGHDIAVVQRADSDKPLPIGARSIRADRRRLAEAAVVLRAFRADVVVDLILSSGRQATEMMHVFGGHAGRVVVASSMDVYRATGILHGLEEGPVESLPLREESPLRTKLQTYPAAQVKILQQVFPWLDDEYDKIPVEHAVLTDRDLPGTVLRLPMIYGPGDPLHRFFPVLKRMDDRRSVIVLGRSGAEWRGPRGYVENMAAGIVLAALSERASGRVYNVGEAESLPELEWARLLAVAAGWSGDFIVVDDDDAPASVRMQGNLAQHCVVDTTRIRSELGYRELVMREEALRRTVAWERANVPAIGNPAQFDYDAEDEAARRARATTPSA